MYLCPSVVHQLHRPPSFVLDPNKNASFHIACGQLLKGFVPSHQDNLQTSRAASHFAETLQLALHNVKIMLFSLSKACNPTRNKSSSCYFLLSSFFFFKTTITILLQQYCSYSVLLSVSSKLPIILFCQCDSLWSALS